MAVVPEALSTVPFFAGVSKRDLRSLASSMHERAVAAGRDVVTQGTGGIAFFVIVEGSAVVEVDGREVKRLGPGDHFGEIALIIDGVPRTATVSAVTDVVVASLSTWNFKPFVRDHPEVAWSLLETLARRAAGAATT